ncbi:RNA 3'-terminal phosphate cyclase [Stereum hirsutum FP-91666 SS1]|uniref:RNA 3'-terminal phosphate cyclase n=1 Tax=Stereum hirsutum (strain FP-91666) TaxID=721885 RepID=UPI0004449812|nr:RNA 3'-terminal phosphate cyclase [Stereum hirsutum FP-91666 SS1]EIM82576.1 RNA 3'-terminal phosphate cyclase [Stereum hirsutum FP-91666 SS1]
MTPLIGLIIEGSTLEGGGQLLRNTVALSSLLCKPVTIQHIRYNRRPPGLKNQHVAGIRLAAEISGAKLTGDKNGSSTITFHPAATGPRLPGFFTADPGTAGSTALLLQIALPCLLFPPPSPLSVKPTSSTEDPQSPTFSSLTSSLTLRGGTNASNAPQMDYTANVFFPFLKRHFGLSPRLKIVKRGYYPKGGGEVHVEMDPVEGPLPAVRLLDRGEIISVQGRAYVAGLPASLASEIASSALSTLTQSSPSLHLDPSLISITPLRESPSQAHGSGSGLILWATTSTGCRFGASSLGAKGKGMDVVGREAAEELISALEPRVGGEMSCTDEWLQDQVVLFMALAEGESVVRTGELTLHTKTAIWVVEQMTDAKFTIEEEPSGTVLMRCRGIGMTASSRSASQSQSA